MTWIALKMLTGDRSKYVAIIFDVTFACFLIAEQSAVFRGVMVRTTSQIRDTHGTDVAGLRSQSHVPFNPRAAGRLGLRRTRVAAGTHNRQPHSAAICVAHVHAQEDRGTPTGTCRLASSRTRRPKPSNNPTWMALSKSSRSQESTRHRPCYRG